MHQQDGQGETPDYHGGDDPVVDPRPLHPESYQRRDNPDNDQDVGQSEQPKTPTSHKESIFAYLRKLRDAGPDRHVELALSGAIVLFALMQLLITVINNIGTSKQVDKIIGAADSIKNSAEQFSGAAQGINGGVWGAVGKLQGQVEQMSRYAGATEASSAIAKEALWAAQGAKITTTGCLFDTGVRQVRLPINNSGRMASGPVLITIYDVVSNGVTHHEFHWRTRNVPSIPTGSSTDYPWATVKIPSMTYSGIDDGTQTIAIAGSIDYKLGRGAAPGDSFKFCYQSQPHKEAEGVHGVTGCDPAAIEAWKKFDGYPDHQEK
jgi:hypothetical protein